MSEREDHPPRHVSIREPLPVVATIEATIAATTVGVREGRPVIASFEPKTDVRGEESLHSGADRRGEPSLPSGGRVRDAWIQTGRARSDREVGDRPAVPEVEAHRPQEVIDVETPEVLPV